MALRLRRGTESERQNLVSPLLEGELIYVTDTGKLFVGDGTATGGVEVIGSGGGGGAGATTLDALTDTDLIGLSDGDVLTYIGASDKWEPVPIPGASALEINDLTNVDAGSLNALDILIFDGFNFIPIPVQTIFAEQQNWRVNIVGDDSTILVDTDTNSFRGLLFGSVEGNVTGDIQGSVFSDDSTLIVDGISGNIFTSQVTSSNDLLLNPEGTGKLKITSSQSTMLATTDGDSFFAGGVFDATTSRGTVTSPIAVNNSDSLFSLIAQSHNGTEYRSSGLLNFNVSDNTVGSEALPGRLDIALLDDDGTYDNAFARLESNGIFTVRAIQTPGISTTDKTGLLAKVSGGIGLQGTIVYDTTLSGLSYYHDTDGWNNVLTGNKPVETTSFIKPGVYADDAARDAAITTPTAGMMVFNSTGTKFQGYTGSAWVDLN